MKTSFYTKAITLLFVFGITTSCQNTGGLWLGEGDNKGKSYTFGSSEDNQRLLDIAEAYSNKDTDKLLTMYTDEFIGENGRERTENWLQSMETITMSPYKIIPLSLQDGSYRHILAWSKEERVYKDGSYEKLDLMEQFRLDPSGKVDGFKQWVAIDSVNFGRRFGGKFFGKKKGEYSGRPFTFSNRNETKAIEDLAVAYNNMDVAEMQKIFGDEFTSNDYEGNKMTLKNDDMKSVFAPYASVNWTIYSIIPIKIANTDASSGVIVYSHEKRTFKNGKKWEKDLMEIFYFDLEGKITGMEQFAKP